MKTASLISSRLLATARRACFCSLVAIVVAGVVGPVRAQDTGTNLIPNGKLETPNETGTWAVNWGRPKVGKSSYEIEDGKRFIRLQATEPGQMIMIYQQVGLSGAKAVEVSIRARVTDLRRGAQSWFDARVICNFRNAESKEFPGNGGKSISFGGSTDGWVERKVSFAVPEGSVFLAVMPSLFNVEAGTFDFSEISVRPIDSAELAAAAH